jgi:5-methylcytosine-specific restriction endonuclease McrA
MTESELKSKYRQKAKDSFTTKLNLFIYNLVISKQTTLDATEFRKFEISDNLVLSYSANYWQTDRKEYVLGTEMKPDDIFKEMNKFKTSNNELIKNMEGQYVDNFEEVFPLIGFKELVENQECAYCKISIEMVNQLAKVQKLFKKSERGWSLEIDRKNSNKEYAKDNCVMACYWCNNAKTDEFTHDEFVEIGKAIQSVWEKRLS